MFKSFLPKIMAIPASALPIALLNSFGHVSPVNGQPQRQPDTVVTFIKCGPTPPIIIHGRRTSPHPSVSAARATTTTTTGSSSSG